MKHFDFEYNTPIVIYGVGLRGQLFHHNLEKSGFTNIQFFLDINAANKCPILGKDVLAPTSDTISSQIKAHAIVVISVANIFEHEEIANWLYSLGFENIILKYLSGASTSRSKRIVNDIFDNILDMKYYQTKFKPVQQVPKYDNFTSEHGFTDSILRVVDRDYLIVAVPVELIFSLNKENKLTPYKTEELEKKYGLTKTFDAPFFSVSQQIRLFEYFNTGKQYDLKKYVDMIRFNYELIGKTLTESEIDRIISSREEVYCEMNNMLSIIDDFFRENPIKLKWNSKGYFNILDGKHRVALFFIKGLKSIPARITREDYDQWLNPVTLKKINILTDTNKFVHLLHPKFENKDIITHFHSYTLLTLIKLIIDKNHDYKTLSALCIGLESIYFFQYFYKMGMQVQLFVKDKEDYKVAKILNELSYIGEDFIKFAPYFQNEQPHNYNIIFMPTVTSHQDSDDFKNLLAETISTNPNYYVVICKADSKNKIASELRNVHFDCCTQLGRAHTDEGQLISILFSRNKLAIRTSKIKGGNSQIKNGYQKPSGHFLLRKV